MRNLIPALLLGLTSEITCSQAALQWKTGEGFRWVDLQPPATGKPGFSLLTPSQTGIDFTNRLEEWNGAANRVLVNGSGVALGDYDNDGLVDIYFCGLDTPNALYKNLGNWKFKDVTTEAGLTLAGKFFRGAVFADLDGDAQLDLLISVTGRGVLCFLNEGNGKFKETTATAGTASSRGSLTMALSDVDGNGTLDLYISNNRAEDIRDRGQVDLTMVKGQIVIPPQFEDRLVMSNKLLLEYGEPDQLMLNDGKGTFRPVPWNTGVFLNEQGQPLNKAPLDWALTATFRDINNDGFPDLYVCNDYWTPDRIWINDGKGRFRALANFSWRNMSASSMGVDFADLDHDGSPEFFVVDMLSRDPRLRKRQMLAQNLTMWPMGLSDDRPQLMRNTLYHNRGDGTFAEIAHYAGLQASDWSWSPIFIDVDLDGFEDLLITAGHARDVQDLDAEAQLKSRQKSYRGFTNSIARQQAFVQDKMLNERLYPELSMPIVAFRNSGKLQFQEMTASWGTERKGVHHGMASADLDNDGDLDLVVNALGDAAGIYRNESNAGRILVRLKGQNPNTQGIGAKVKLLNGAVPMQSQEIVSGGRYLSGSDPILMFATAAKKSGMTLEILWRNGKQSVLNDVKANRLYEVEEAFARPASATTDLPKDKNPLFRDISNVLNHSHLEEFFDDFARQPLLPYKLSQLGPGVAWYDYDQDGHDDIFIGSGKGGLPAFFRGDGKGNFQGMSPAPFQEKVSRDQTSILGYRVGAKQTLILTGSANYESGDTNQAAVYAYDLKNKKISEAVSGNIASTGPMALGDLDGDGPLELFVGGRVIAGRYPESADSRIYRHKDGHWQLDPTNSIPLKKAGLVSAAVWSDVNADGLPELILACEWGPIKVFQNNRGVLRDAPAALGLDQWTGLWSGVTTGDLDNDGDLDIVAANWGLNSEFRASPKRPLIFYYGDLMDRGQIDILETEYDPRNGAVTPTRMFKDLVSAIPALIKNFSTHRVFSEAPLSQFLGDPFSRLQTVKATTLATTIFFNKGGRFEPVELPREAQLSPAFAVNVADFDGDGNEDIFLSQNFFSTRPTLSRLDSGRGLLLLGDGTGKFEAMAGTDSGIMVYGEQRGAAFADFNEDGRLDLAVSQNGAGTHLYQNTRAKPGMRIVLKGPLGNPDAAGAVVRLVAGNKTGPAREIHAGSGYWSQDSSTQILTLSESPAEILVRWPGGKLTRSVIPKGALKVVVDVEGNIQ